MRYLGLATIALLPAVALGDEISIVPAYTGSPDDLVVVRSSRSSCADDARASRVVHSYDGSVLTLSLPPADPNIYCAAVLGSREMGYTLRELGMTQFPESLTVRYVYQNGSDSLQKTFAKRPQFSGTPKLAAGWWKSWQGTLTWHQSNTQLGALVAGQADDGAATWRIGGSPVAGSRGSFDIYEVNGGFSLRGQPSGQPAIKIDSSFEFVIEGPALVWTRFAGTDIWYPARPYYFDEELNQKRGFYSQYNGVLLTGSWRVAADDTPVQIEQMPTDPIEGTQPYIVTVSGQRGTLACDFDSCQFDASLPAPLGGTDVLNAGITDDRMSQLTATGWTTLLVRDK